MVDYFFMISQNKSVLPAVTTQCPSESLIVKQKKKSVIKRKKNVESYEIK